jgi:hypothetical protein
LIAGKSDGQHPQQQQYSFFNIIACSWTFTWQNVMRFYVNGVRLWCGFIFIMIFNNLIIKKN